MIKNVNMSLVFAFDLNEFAWTELRQSAHAMLVDDMLKICGKMIEAALTIR